MNAATTTVRVVTVAYNPGGELERFLTSLEAATVQPLNVVIADNGTEHEVVARAARTHQARVVSAGANLGYGGGVNLAAQNLSEDWLVVANPDLVWHPGSLDRLLAAGKTHPRAGCLGPRILNQDGSIYPSGRALPTLIRGTGHALLAHLWATNPFSAAYYSQNQGTQPRQVGWLSGACLLIPRRVWQTLGGFCDDYFMFFEDVDLGARVSQAGWCNLQVPEAVVTHKQGASWKARPEPMIRAHHESARRYLAGVYAARWQAPLRWGISAGLHLHEALALRRARAPRPKQCAAPTL